MSSNPTTLHQRMNPPATLNRTRVCCLSLELNYVGCVVALATKPAPAVTLWKTPPDPPLETHAQEGVLQEASIVTTSPFLFPEEEEEEKEEEEDTIEAEEEEEGGADCPFLADTLAETDLEEMAMHETEDNNVFQWFKKRIAPEPHQVVRYTRGGSPLWVSCQHIPSDQDVPPCTCGAKRTFEFQA